LGVDVSKIKKVTVWGNHSAHLHPDLSNAVVGEQKVEEVIFHSNFLFMWLVDK